MIDVRTIREPAERRKFDNPDDRRDFLRRHLSSVSPFLGFRVDEVLSGRVKDFFTQPQSVGAIEETIKEAKSVISRGDHPEASIIDPASYCLNHLTNHFPKSGFIAPRVEYGLMPRFTTHFCLNGCVTSHENGNWEDSTISIIVPVKDITETAEVFLPQDVRYFGRFQLPQSSIVIVPKGMVVPQDAKFRVESYPHSNADDLRRITAQRMFDLGYLPVQIGKWGWESEPYRARSPSGEGLCHQLGTFVMGGFFPDEAIRLCSIAELIGAKSLSLNDLSDSNYRLEADIMDPFQRFFDFRKIRPREALSGSEFDRRIPNDFIKVLGPGDDFWSYRCSKIWCETETRKSYVKEQVEAYRQRMKSLITS